jgi:hypothetical protein
LEKLFEEEEKIVFLFIFNISNSAFLRPPAA